MSYFAGAALAALLGSAFAGAACASMGSLAPHDPAAAANAQQQWIADPATNCLALDSEFADGDAISWQGRCVEGMVSGAGTLSFLNKGRSIETIAGSYGGGMLLPGRVSAAWADGSKYEGSQAGGRFDGPGVFLSATGDKIDGEWKAGALNGKASVVWTNGDRYDGEWKDGKSDGQGTEIWANGNRYEGLWKDGKPVGQNAAASASAAPDGAAVAAAAVAAPVLSAAATMPPATKPLQTATTAATSETIGDADDRPLPLHDFIGKSLVAVDGSTIDLSQTEGGLARNITLPNGVAQQTAFAFMNDRIGTVSSRSTTVGLFRRNGDEIDIDYTDGNIETMKPDAAGGLLQTAHSPDGATSCTAWYPQGHLFSQDERKAAVQEYAARLGVAAAAAPKNRHAALSASHSCGGGFLIGVAEAESPSASGAGQGNRPPAAPAVISISGQSSTQTEKLPASHNEVSAGLQTIPVRSSAVHPIDAPYEPSTAQPSVEEARFTADTAPMPASAAPLVPGAPASSSNASTCLSVTSNGEYWGFQNRCANAVQFSYCEMNDANPLTSCHRTSVSGSVAANGFSALIGDRSLSEQGVKHDFRWMACDGGAGEVVPHLDSVDPPVGRCLRTVAAANGAGASRDSAGS